MANSNSINERTNVDSVELFIINNLLKGQEVLIPDFGHLKLKSLGERRTVSFTPADGNDPLQRIIPVIGEGEKNDFKALYAIVSVPLKQGKVVKLPRVGVFSPVKNEKGEIRVSFILSYYLRNLLREESEKKEEIKEVINEVKENEEIKKTEDVKKVETIDETEEVSDTLTRNDETKKGDAVKNSPKSQREAPKVGDTLVPQDDIVESSKSKGWWLNLLLIVVVLVIIAFLIVKMTGRKAANGRGELIPQKEMIDLPSLAEQHYGHRAFWIYIYEANIDKLNSPVNISKHVSSLIYPDLKAEYDVDVTDSMEIRRANILSDIVLNKRRK